MSRIHKVNVVCTAILQIEHNPGQMICADILSKILSADCIILAENTAQGAAGIKDSTAALCPADTRLLPLMKHCLGNSDLVPAPAKSRFFAAVNAAFSRAKPAKLFVSHGFSLFFQKKSKGLTFRKGCLKGFESLHG